MKFVDDKGIQEFKEGVVGKELEWSEKEGFMKVVRFTLAEKGVGMGDIIKISGDFGSLLGVGRSHVARGN